MKLLLDIVPQLSGSCKSPPLTLPCDRVDKCLGRGFVPKVSPPTSHPLANLNMRSIICSGSMKSSFDCFTCFFVLAYW